MKQKRTPKRKVVAPKSNVVRLKVTPTLWRYQGIHELFFGAKWDDFWFIERMWAIYSQRVYRNPRPTHIDAVMRRLRDEVRNTDPNTLVKLFPWTPSKDERSFPSQKVRRFHPTSTLESRPLRARATSAPVNPILLKTFTTSTQPPPNKQVFVNTTIPVAQW